ncbi:hypothetical protein Tco_1360838 [Tanacetum coccineum]
MPPWRNPGIFMMFYETYLWHERMEERLDLFVDQFSNRMNDMMNLEMWGSYRWNEKRRRKSVIMQVFDPILKIVIGEEDENMEDYL